MKKFLTMFLIILLCVSAFSGCDNVLPQNGGSQTTNDTLNTNVECEHNWERIGNLNESTAQDKCTKCGETRQYTDPDSINPDCEHDWERISNYNESTARDRCTICGETRLYTDPDSLSGNRLLYAMTIAETLPSCVVFEYKDEKPYCFYAYNTEGKLCRVFWNDFAGLKEKDIIAVECDGDFKALSYDEYPDGGWTPQYEITATNVYTTDNGINDHVPYDSMLNLEIIDGKFRFQRIATTPCIVYSNSPITDMSNGTMYDDRHDILTAIFRATDGKDAIMDTTECEFLHYIYMFDNEREDVPWHYRFAICSCGAVMITNNNQFLCTIKISDDEIQTILDSFGINQGNPENHNWQVTSQTSDCWSITVNYACSKCGMEKFTHEDSALPYHSWAEKTDEGKTTFSCIRCNESYTFLSEIRTFSYAQALEEYKIGDPGVKHEHFNNWNVESEITGAIDAIVRAKFELTIEYDTISVSYDEISNMWRVDFWTLDLDGNSQSVYINDNGLTCYIVYGE